MVLSNVEMIITSALLSTISHKRHGRRAGYDDLDDDVVDVWDFGDDVFDACGFDAFEFVVLDFECTITRPALATSVNDTRRE